jgi:hypothetical protein
MNILINILVLSCLQYYLHAQYFSSAIRGNIPRLGKRGDTLNGLNVARPLQLYTNQEMSGQLLRSPMIDNSKVLDDVWAVKMYKIRADMNNGLLSETRKNFDDYIQNSLYNLLSDIVRYRKEHINE